MIALYIVISYLVMLGMIIVSYDNTRTPLEAWLVFVVSPITLPIIIGMNIAENEK